MSERSFWANRYGIPESMVDDAGMERARRFQAEVASAFSNPPKSEEEPKTQQPTHKAENG